VVRGRSIQSELFERHAYSPAGELLLSRRRAARVFLKAHFVSRLELGILVDLLCDSQAGLPAEALAKAGLV